MKFLGRWPALAVGLFLVAAVAGFAALAPLCTPADPNAQLLRQAFEPPAAAAPLGRDELGRDILARVAYGARLSLLVGVSVVGISALLGTVIGTVAAFRSGWTDETIMRAIDMLLAFPGLLLAIALAAVLGPSVRSTILALSATGWTGYARIVRNEVAAWKEREMVTAARALGASSWRLAIRHVLPQILPPLAVQLAAGLAGAIVAEASLSFLGLGASPPTPTWGGMINQARAFLLVAPHLALAPGLALSLTVLGFSLVGDGLRDYFDVRIATPPTPAPSESRAGVR